MPIFIENYNWRQTKEFVIIHVPIKGLHSNNADIFTSDNYLKIHSSPFMFEVCLWQPVIDEESTCTIDNEGATFKLVKTTADDWPTLKANLTRQEILEVKKKAIDEAHFKAKCKLEETKAKKNERQRAAVREQISLNNQELDSMNRTREQERSAALAQMGWSSTTSTTKQSHTPEIKKNVKEIFQKCRGDELKPLVPGPRKMAQIPVTFTSRVFPTPSRESKAAEEQEWLSKQAEARRKTGFLAADLRPEEQDPIWLNDKAQSFYSVGNYQGAVCAYSHALTLNSRLYELYAGRGMAHLALGNFNGALTDTSKALELLTPPVPQNEEARARCHLCRGSALVGLGLKPQALGELRAAQALRPKDPDILTALSEVEM